MAMASSTSHVYKKCNETIILPPRRRLGPQFALHTRFLVVAALAVAAAMAVVVVVAMSGYM